MDQANSQDSIVLVDDDKEDRRYARAILSDNNYRVYEAINGQRMHEIILSVPVDLILLDLRLPGESGIALIDRIRAATNAPIIILSGVHNDTEKQIGLENGADDYLTKPFSPRELCARIKANLRRYKELGAKKTPEKAIHIGEWILDDRNIRLLSRGGAACPLTIQEYKILESMALSDSHTLTRLDQANHDLGRSIDIHITRLRKKFSRLLNPPEIHTIRGLGYKLASPVNLGSSAKP